MNSDQAIKDLEEVARYLVQEELPVPGLLIETVESVAEWLKDLNIRPVTTEWLIEQISEHQLLVEVSGGCVQDIYLDGEPVPYDIDEQDEDAGWVDSDDEFFASLDAENEDWENQHLPEFARPGSSSTPVDFQLPHAAALRILEEEFGIDAQEDEDNA